MKCMYTVLICIYCTCVAATLFNDDENRGHQKRSSENPASVHNISIPMVTRKNLLFGVLLPSDEHMPDGPTMKGVLPAMMLAIDNIVASDGILPGFNITLEYRDTQCSSTLGPLAAFDIINRGRRPGLYIETIPQAILKWLILSLFHVMQTFFSDPFASTCWLRCHDTLAYGRFQSWRPVAFLIHS